LFTLIFTNPKAPPKPQPKISQSKRSLKLGKKGKIILGIMLTAVIVASCFAFYPRENKTVPVAPQPSIKPNAAPINATVTPTATPQPPPNIIDQIVNTITGTITDDSYMIVKNAQNLNSTTWKKIAAYAWNYFDKEVNPTTGLIGSSGEFSAFTDWDLGVYIQAIIDAQTIGILDQNGTLGSSDRIEKVLIFLETRELNSTTHYPYWFYTSEGKNYKENSATGVDIVDTGRLFVALNNLKNFNTTLATRIDNFVYNVNGNRSNYAVLVPGVKADCQTSNSIYSYFYASGFASFWPQEMANAPDKILDNILSSQTIPYGNITVHKGMILTEPLFGALFDLNSPEKIKTLVQETYSAHETFYNLTGKYRAFSEGPSFGDWVYEWVVYGDQLWAIKAIDQTDRDMTPVIYIKTAFCFLALNNTAFAKNMVIHLEKAFPDSDLGYYNGIDELENKLPEGRSVHTNGLILGAAKYAIQPN
jgi:hypothetical protein